MKLQFEYKGVLWMSEFKNSYSDPTSFGSLIISVCISQNVKKGWLSPKMIFGDGWKKVSNDVEYEALTDRFLKGIEVSKWTKDKFRDMSIIHIENLIKRWDEWEEWPKCFGNIRIDSNGHYFEGEGRETQLRLVSNGRP